MKTTHSEKRQQVWIAGWTNALNSCIGNNPAAIADRVLKDFDERFPEPKKLKEYEPVAETTQIRERLVAFFNIKKLFPVMSHEDLLKEIENNLLLIRDIKSRYSIDYITHGDQLLVTVNPLPSSPAKIVRERDTFHDVPPEYPNGDDLTPKYDQEDLKCINNECAEDCNACKLDFEEKMYLLPCEEEKLNHEVIVECPACNCIFDILGHVFENVVDKESDPDALNERKTPERDTNTYLPKS